MATYNFTLPGPMPYYYQKDSLWTDPNKKDTYISTEFADSGCAASCLAMVASYFNNEDITPYVLYKAKKIRSNGYVESWNTNGCTVTTQTKTLEQAKQIIFDELYINHRPVIIWLSPSHYVVAYGLKGTIDNKTTYANSVILTRDPWDPLKTNFNEVLTKSPTKSYAGKINTVTF